MYRIMLAAFSAAVFTAPALVSAQQTQRINPVIELLEQKKQIFAISYPTPGRGGARGGGARDGGAGRGGGAVAGGAATAGAAANAGSAARGGNAATGAGAAATGGAAAAATPATPPVPPRTPLDLAKETLAYGKADALFSSSLENGNNFDRSYPAFSAFMEALTEAGSFTKTPHHRLLAPMGPKSPIIHNDSLFNQHYSQMLNAGTAIMTFPHVESAEELQRGLNAMRFRSNGGTRPDDVGNAPAHWGLTEAEYRHKADLWPLNPDGELVAWIIIESERGLANLKEIAAVKGLGGIIVGAGTLGGVFRGNPEGLEAAVQSILAACKANNLACGYPVGESNIEARMKEGFSIHIVQTWGGAGFRTVELGRRLGGRDGDN